MKYPIIFLDIDGVLQPFINDKRYEVDRQKIQQDLAIKFDDDYYYVMDDYELAGIVVDWEKESIDCLKKLIKQTDARIVLSTDWRCFRPYSEMLKVFRIHGLDSYIIGQTRFIQSFTRDDLGYVVGCRDYDAFLRRDEFVEAYEKDHRVLENQDDFRVYYDGFDDELAREFHVDFEGAKRNRLYNREIEVLTYVKENHVERYVALDDIDMRIGLKGHAVYISYQDAYFKEKHYQEALKILMENKE